MHVIKCYPSLFLICAYLVQKGFSQGGQSANAAHPAASELKPRDEPLSHGCPDDTYHCKNPPMCVPMEDLCTDFNPCSDWDEIDQICPFTCQPHKFKCQNVSQCVLKTYLCDGKRDCEDNSDEQDCEESKETLCGNDADFFQCDDRSDCIFTDDVCDGHRDCDDGSDEKHNCYELCENKNCGPNQHCLPTHTDVQCVCKDGFKLQEDGLSCVEMLYCGASDLDRLCSQECVEGFYRPHCRCGHGYMLGRDGRTCEAMGEAGIFIASTTTAIYRKELPDGEHALVLDGLDGVGGIAVDSHQKRVFWSESGSSSIKPRVMTTTLDEPESKKVVFSFGLEKPTSLAFDYLAKNLYIVDQGPPAIIACELLHHHSATILNNTVLRSPESLALHPEEGVLYYTEIGDKAAIMKGSMDGRSTEELVTSNVLHPVSLLVDLTTRRLYWADLFHHRIFNVDLDGKNKRTVSVHGGTGNWGASSPSLFTIFEDRMLWTSTKSDKVFSARKFTGGNQTVSFSGIHGLTDVEVMHTSLQNEWGINYCQSSRCHLCLLNKHLEGSCFCSNGYQVGFTEQFCEYNEEPPVLLVASMNKILQIPLNMTRKPSMTSLSVLGTTHRVSDISFLSGKKEAIYTDYTPHKDGGETVSIMRIPLVGDNPRPQRILTNLTSVPSIAVDESSSLLFWIDQFENSAHVATLDGQYQTRLGINFTSTPLAIAIDQIQKILYISESRIQKVGVIWRCAPDGTRCTKLVSERLHLPNHLLVQGQQLFWSDYWRGEISSVDQWGDERQTVAITKEKPLSFTIYRSKLYWTEELSTGLFYKRIHTQGGFQGYIELHATRPTGLVAAFPSNLANPSACHAQTECEHICVATGRNEMTCMCSEGFVFNQDHDGCVMVNGTSNCDGFWCKAHSVCLDADLQCDGDVDCSDWSDEEGCPTLSPEDRFCDPEDFQCVVDGSCITGHFQCDGDPDCLDGSDETEELCPKIICNEDDHQCVDDGKCVAGMFVCDDDKDCEDGSDEVGCTQKACVTGEFRCVGGECVSEWDLCDGRADCAGGEDEANCTTSKVDCSEFQFKCNDGSCILAMEKCDAVENCPKGEDELGCETDKCSGDQFRCLDGKCIPKSAVCDDKADCSYYEDEDECEIACKMGQYQCWDKTCIPRTQFCDHEINCPDGSDEGLDCALLATTTTTTAKPSTVCFGFQCVLGECIDAKKRCNGQLDCLDMSDELSCKKTCKNTRHRCNQLCVDTPTGFECACRDGFFLDTDDHTCLDVNECDDDNGGCSQICVNKKTLASPITPIPFQGYKCECRHGFARSKINNHHCTPRGPTPTLYAASLIGVSEVNLWMWMDRRQNDTLVAVFHKHHNETVVAETRTAPFKMDLDINRQTLYWVTHRQNVVQKINGKLETKLVSSGDVSDMAIDWLTGNLYTVHLGSNMVSQICVRSPDGFVSVVYTTTKIIECLALFPAMGFLFFSVKSHSPTRHDKIYVASMDGSVPNELKAVSEQLESLHITDMCFDEGSRRLFFYTHSTGNVASFSFGDEKVTIHQSGKSGIRALDVFGGWLYMVEQNVVESYPLFKVSQLDGKPSWKYSHLQDIFISHPARQKAAWNPCERLPCMYMCVMTPTGGKCVCPNGHKMNSNPDCIGPKVQTTGETKTTLRSPATSESEATQRPPAARETPPSIASKASITNPITEAKATKTTPTSSTRQLFNKSSQETPTLIFHPFRCDLVCHNGGRCELTEGRESCVCLEGFEGSRCEKRLEGVQQSDSPSYKWVAGVVLALLTLLVGGFAIWYCRYKRHQGAMSSIRFQKHKKLPVCTKEDKEELVPEISFGNPGFQDEIDEEADLRDPDTDWWKRLIQRSKKTVDTAFTLGGAKTREQDDDMRGDSGYDCGDMADYGDSTDKTRLLL